MIRLHRRPRPVVSIAALAALLWLAPAPAGATDADDLCDSLDDPCVVSTTVSVDAGSVLDFDTRTLSLAPSGRIIWRSNLTITAGDCDFAPGSKIVEDKATSPGTGFLSLNCDQSTLAGAITTVGAGVLVEGDGPHVLSGKIQAKGDQVGVIAVDVYGLPGHITVSGQIKAKAKLGPPPGEFRLVTNFGDVLVAATAKIKLQGLTADPFNEIVWLEAGSGSLTVDGKIDARAKTGAYAFNLEADQATTFGPKAQIKANAKETGAEIAINSQSASVTLRGKINAKVSNASDGARVHVCAADDITVDAAKIDASDKGFDSSIILGAGDRVRLINKPKLTAKTDGDIELCGNTTGVTGVGTAKIVPDPEAVGKNICLSPNSQVIFFLDCNQ
jgi:hypothetical protein